MWQRYFGPMARIVGIDIDPACKAHEAPGIFVEPATELRQFLSGSLKIWRAGCGTR